MPMVLAWFATHQGVPMYRAVPRCCVIAYEKPNSVQTLTTKGVLGKRFLERVDGVPWPARDPRYEL